MKETNEITQIIKEKLVECPNCGYRLTQKSSYSSICKVCGLKINVETKNERFAQLLFYAGVLCFAAGALAFIFLLR